MNILGPVRNGQSSNTAVNMDAYGRVGSEAAEVKIEALALHLRVSTEWLSIAHGIR